MTEPEIALVLSPERWFDDLHRHCTDHGGARVRQVVVDPAVALEEDFDVLVVGHRWPGLTHGFVADVRARGRAVLGVVDPAEPAAIEHLTRLGVDATVTSDAAPEAVVAALRAVTPPAARAAAMPHDAARATTARAAVVAVGGPAGSGATEVALGLAHALTEPGRRVVLLDADETAPSVAPRLALPIDPNLRTAVDAVEHGIGRLDDGLARVGGLAVLVGLPNSAAWAQLRAGEVARVVEVLGGGPAPRLVVTDVGACLGHLDGGERGRSPISRSLLAVATAVVAVGAGNPVGLLRLLDWAAGARALATDTPFHVVINRAPTDEYRRGELTDEIARELTPAGLVFAPSDRRVETAAWAGTSVTRGPFTRALQTLAAAVVPMVVV